MRSCEKLFGLRYFLSKKNDVACKGYIDASTGNGDKVWSFYIRYSQASQDYTTSFARRYDCHRNPLEELKHAPN